jgi:hypothetical protein
MRNLNAATQRGEEAARQLEPYRASPIEMWKAAIELTTFQHSSVIRI